MPLEIRVPAMGESITEVQIGAWLKQEGATAGKDEPLVEIESEKATVEVSAPEAGQLTQILKRQGETARVGDVIGHFLPAVQVSGSAASSPRAEEAPAAKPAEAETQAESKADSQPAKGRGAGPDDDERRDQAKASNEPRVMPAAARVLAQEGLRAEEVPPTGPGGRLLKEDVVSYADRDDGPVRTPSSAETKSSPLAREQTASAAARPSAVAGRSGGIAGAVIREDWPRDEEVVPMTPMRRAIAQRLVAAQQAAALVTTFNEIDMSALAALRHEYREGFQSKYGIKLGMMSFFVKAAVDSLRLFPQVNAEIRDNSIVYRNYYDIGVAVGGGKGLVVPVVRNAERLSFAEIEIAIDYLARRARDNKLQVEELTGGTFTISNGGIYGSLLSTPIVNPPQSGVLGLHAIEERPVARDGQVVVRPMMYVALTYDHRLVDGREAVTFLRRIKEVIEEPARMLLEV